MRTGISIRYPVTEKSIEVEENSDKEKAGF